MPITLQKTSAKRRDFRRFYSFAMQKLKGPAPFRRQAEFPGISDDPLLITITEYGNRIQFEAMLFTRERAAGNHLRLDG